MNKGEMIAALHQARSVWEGLLAGLPRERMLAPATLGGWSVKDAVAHVAWVEGQTAGMLRARSLAGAAELWRLPVDERNAVVVAGARAEALEAVLAEGAAAHQALMAAVEEVPRQDWDGADWFAALPGVWPPSRVVEVNVLQHYYAHTEDLVQLVRLSV